MFTEDYIKSLKGEALADYLAMIPVWWGGSKTSRGKGRNLTHSELSCLIWATYLRSGGDGITFKRSELNILLAIAFGWSADFCGAIVTRMYKRGLFALCGDEKLKSKVARFVFTPYGEDCYNEFVRVYLDRAAKFRAIVDVDKKGIRFKVKELALNATF